MTIDIISVGKIKEDFVLEGIRHYAHYLKRTATLTFRHVPAEAEPKNPSAKDIEIIREKEGDALIKKARGNFVIALSPEGRQMKSEGFATILKEIQVYKGGKVSFLIGGSHGLPEAVKKEANLLLSLSKLTFPHQLTALILTEQIFRAMKINQGEPYHK